MDDNATNTTNETTSNITDSSTNEATSTAIGGTTNKAINTITYRTTKITDKLPIGTEVCIKGEVDEVTVGGDYMVKIRHNEGSVWVPPGCLIDLEAERLTARTKGRNEAWRTAQAIIQASQEELLGVFETLHPRTALKKYTAEEAIARWYEHLQEQNPEAGDLVRYCGEIGLVTKTYTHGTSVPVIFSNGKVLDAALSGITRTGRKVDMADLLGLLSRIQDE